MACEIRIGTSGWHYKHWRGAFYPADVSAMRMFAYYQRHFDTVELNNSFYRLPTEAAFDAWREATPKNFVFAVKASRFLTHRIKLKDPERALDNFLPRAERLGRKLGPILFQLPPKWNVNLERLEGLLELLPKKNRYAFEFRNPTWHTQAVHSTLQKHNAAFCIYELAGFSSAINVTADFAYVRLHGPGGKYQGSYSDDQLAAWAERVAKWSHKLKAIYIYFDNDQAGYAAQNAMRLKELVSTRRTTARRELSAA